MKTKKRGLYSVSTAFRIAFPLGAFLSISIIDKSSICILALFLRFCRLRRLFTLLMFFVFEVIFWLKLVLVLIFPTFRFRYYQSHFVCVLGHELNLNIFCFTFLFNSRPHLLSRLLLRSYFFLLRQTFFRFTILPLFRHFA